LPVATRELVERDWGQQIDGLLTMIEHGELRSNVVSPSRRIERVDGSVRRDQRAINLVLWFRRTPSPALMLVRITSSDLGLAGDFGAGLDFVWVMPQSFQAGAFGSRRIAKSST